MTAIVRVFIHTGLISAPVSSSGGRYTTDSVSQLKQPYKAREKLTVSSTAMTTSASITASIPNIALAFVQVQPGKRVHYEVTPGTAAAVTDADSSSPIMEGDTLLQIGPDYRLSFLENTEV